MESLKKIWSSPWLFSVLILLTFVVVTKGRIIGAFAPMGRFILPAVIVYAVYRLIRSSLQKKFSSLGKRFQEELMRQQQMQNQGRGGAGKMRHDGPIIEICPKCGKQKSASCRNH